MRLTLTGSPTSPRAGAAYLGCGGDTSGDERSSVPIVLLDDRRGDLLRVGRTVSARLLLPQLRLRRRRARAAHQKAYQFGIGA